MKEWLLASFIVGLTKIRASSLPAYSCCSICGGMLVAWGSILVCFSPWGLWGTWPPVGPDFCAAWAPINFQEKKYNKKPNTVFIITVESWEFYCCSVTFLRIKIFEIDKIILRSTYIWRTWLNDVNQFLLPISPCCVHLDHLWLLALSLLTRDHSDGLGLARAISWWHFDDLWLNTLCCRFW